QGGNDRTGAGQDEARRLQHPDSELPARKHSQQGPGDADEHAHGGPSQTRRLVVQRKRHLQDSIKRVEIRICAKTRQSA
ncbi:hypothetical protein DTX79_17825, partial [Bacilli bacterium]